MKRIVNGVTYNTDTSTVLGRIEYEGDDGKVEETLYQTRGGAFFLDEQLEREIWNEKSRQNETKITNLFVPKSREQAHAWIIEDNVEIEHNPFDDPPEAVAENEPGATIYIRVPASLKKRVDEAAAEAETSGNVWTMRCMEACLGDLPDELFLAWNIAATGGRIPNDWNQAKYVEAMSLIARLLEEYVEPKFGTDAFANAHHGSSGMSGDRIREEYAAFERPSRE